MARINKRTRSASTDIPIHEPAAVQTFTKGQELARLVNCALLGEQTFYVDGASIEDRIFELAQVVDAGEVSRMAVDTRLTMGLRHTPILLLVALAKREDGRSFVRGAANFVLRTPKDGMDLLALYWKHNPAPAGKRHAPVAACIRGALRDGFDRWTDYQIAKYGTLKDKVDVRLRDLLFLSHPMPAPGGPGQEMVRSELFLALADDTIRAPDTWEAGLSAPGADKHAVWTRLLTENKLGALALVRNLRNMEQVGVEPALVREALAKTKAADVWPWQALGAAREAPAYTHDLDALMLRSAGTLPIIPGRTAVMVDVSGSMNAPLSAKGKMTRMDAAYGLAVVLRERCEKMALGSFSNSLKMLVGNGSMPRGKVLADLIDKSQPHGGTDLGGSLSALLAHPEMAGLDRVVILTDEQSQTRVSRPGLPIFCVNVAPFQRGVNFEGPVTRINGWSGGVVRFLAQQITGTLPAAAGEDDAED